MKATNHSAILLRDARRRAGLSQRDLALKAGTVQSVVARVEGGHTSPSVDTLSRLLHAAGFDYRAAIAPRPAEDSVIALYKKDIDRSLLRENARRSVDRRVLALEALSSFAKEARQAGKTRAVTRKKVSTSG
jgi:transcriptional regulator with XRE-family HTH domain